MNERDGERAEAELEAIAAGHRDERPPASPTRVRDDEDGPTLHEELERLERQVARVR